MVFTVREIAHRGVVHVRPMRVQSASISTSRWLAAVAATLAVLHERATSSTAMPDLLTSHGSTLPLGALVGIGPIALVAILGYTLFALAKDPRAIAVHDRIDRHVVAYALFSSLALGAVRHADLHATVAALAAATVAAGLAHVRVQAAIADGHVARWIGIPFALALGSSATFAVAAVDTAIIAAGGPSMAVVACATLVVLGVHGCLRFREAVLPGLVGWILVTVCTSTLATTELAGVAFLGGTACAATAIATTIARWSAPPQRARTVRR